MILEWKRKENFASYSKRPLYQQQDLADQIGLSTAQNYRKSHFLV